MKGPGASMLWSISANIATRRPAKGIPIANTRRIINPVGVVSDVMIAMS